MAEDWRRRQWPRPVNEPDFWPVVAAIALGVLIAVIAVIFFI